VTDTPDPWAAFCRELLLERFGKPVGERCPSPAERARALRLVSDRTHEEQRKDAG